MQVTLVEPRTIQRSEGKAKRVIDRQVALMKIQQLSLFSENKPGHVIAPCRLLAQRRHRHPRPVAGRHPAVRHPAPDRVGLAEGQALLESAGFVVKVTEVVAVEVPDRPGRPGRGAGPLRRTAINIEYMYAFPFVRREKAVLIFRFDQPDAAIETLRARGINVLDSTALEIR